MSDSRFVRFDWAAKRLLRNKTNFVVLEGLLTVLLGESIRIDHILESEGNQEEFDDKFNRVDMLAENSKGELIIIEVQNSRELDYFHRMLYGTSKTIAEYMHRGEPYEKVRKIYSVNIVYFELGQGLDYVYHGKTTFLGIHNNDVLKLSVHQQERFIKKEAGDIFPEYYVLRVNDFDKHAITPLDEWISFLKTGEIPDTATASGLPEARERLRIDSLPEKERKSYESHMEALRYQRSVIETGIYEGYRDGLAEGKAKGLAEGKAKGLAEGKAKGLAEGKAEGLAEGKAKGLAEGEAKGKAEGEKLKQQEIASNLKKANVPIEIIAQTTGLTVDEIQRL
ncbi:Rpn family recombination-promoting nuclease/putative transposase [Bacteroides sp. 519]|uniref:Rpn family recombination-promoting nuclease/putative transposase n=1 Tax=Bacteroides sp. 519 TaxID=2302937 RepID=UPI0013D599C4|nr:Rpn family recombination-promoting nuclease/putative transposase [Bacteroides sp. 519]NDV59070.1 Rpn family recombination-promoting nuclease/putative transposase [Bacteroides sp. 519]